MNVYSRFEYTLIFELSCMSCCSGSTKSLLIDSCVADSHEGHFLHSFKIYLSLIIIHLTIYTKIKISITNTTHEETFASNLSHQTYFLHDRKYASNGVALLRLGCNGPCNIQRYVVSRCESGNQDFVQHILS